MNEISWINYNTLQIIPLPLLSLQKNPVLHHSNVYEMLLTNEKKEMWQDFHSCENQYLSGRNWKMPPDNFKMFEIQI